MDKSVPRADLSSVTRTAASALIRRPGPADRTKADYDPADDLPGVLGTIAAAHGLAAAARLAEAFGGRVIYVPESVEPDHAIAAAIGIDEARWLSETYGGERLEVPLGPFTPATRRMLEIFELLKEGLSEAEIAQRLRCHIRTVRRQRANGGGDPRKLQLLRRVREVQNREQRSSR